VRAPAGIEAARVGPWLVQHVGLTPPIRYELIAGGHSNLTYRVTDADGRAVVLRRPPLGHVLATAHDMAREHRIISAVRPAGVPVAEALALCTDTDVNGAPFYVMSFVDGTVYDNPAKAEALSVEQRRGASDDLVDVLVHLHGLDVDRIGLGDLAKRTDYIERQLARWTKQWASSKTRELAAIDEVQAWLAAHVPPQQGVAVVHGDYRFGNCLVGDDARIAAVLDWELCTLGDPLADLGYLCVYWSDPASGAGRHNDPTAAGGFATRAEIIERYASASGRDVTHVDYYVAFSSWRLAVISEGVYSRYLHGVMGDATGVDLAAFADGVVQLAEAALAAARGRANLG
jgi:aminoglycoside phosphotransferase (APT) family kinase protein